jgi:hypothetical protein
MPSPLASLYSTIDSYKRRGADVAGGLLSDPLETLRAQLVDVKNAGAERARQTDSLYKTPEGLLSFDPDKWSPQAKASHDALTQDALGAVMGATVYHGTPHKFDKFDASKIGSGEGNQAWGHGIYLAENPEVAKMYARQMKGDLLTVDLPDERIASMLDWDKKIAAQGENVRLMARDLSLPANAKGKDLYTTLQGQARDAAIHRGRDTQTTLGSSQARASADLQSMGIPGIQYFDQGSRAIATEPRQLTGSGRWSVVHPGGRVQIFPDEASAWAAYPKPTSNFVVFPGEEGALTILDRNSNFGLGPR